MSKNTKTPRSMPKIAPKITPRIAMGLPNDKTASAYLDENENIKIRLQNMVQLPQKMLADTKAQLWFPQTFEDASALDAPIINACTDVSLYADAMHSMLAQLPADVPVFNHPSAVAMCFSEAFWSFIGEKTNIVTPRKLRVYPKKPDDFKARFEAEGLSYPVRVQWEGHHDNTSIIVVRGPEDWEKCTALNWPFKTYTMVEIDREMLNQHLRFRVCFVGKEAELIQFPYAFRPAKISTEFEPRMPQRGRPLQQLMSQLAKIVPLEHWTAELSVNPARAIQLEHIWPGLPMAHMPRKNDPSQYLHRKIAPKLSALLADPTQWRKLSQRPAGTLH